MHVSLSTLAGHANTALDGFKARALKTSLSAGKPQLRRWLYELEWSPTTSQMPPSVDVQTSDIGMSRVLAVGPALQPAGRAASNDASLVLARSDVEAEAQLTGRKWHGVVLATIGTQAASFTELRLLDVCLSLAQGIAAMGKATPPLWAYTHGTIATRPLASSQGSADAGVWGLSRACRQELPALPIWCIDVGVDSAWQTRSAILDAGKKQGRELSLPDGNVHGLQLSATAEPEAAIRGGGRLYVPRLVMPYEIDAARHLVLPFASIRDGLSMHVADATSALDMAALAHGYAQLETLCQQYVRAAVAELEASSSSDVPVWHHKLVYEWCADGCRRHGAACAFGRDSGSPEAVGGGAAGRAVRAPARRRALLACPLPGAALPGRLAGGRPPRVRERRRRELLQRVRGGRGGRRARAHCAVGAAALPAGECERRGSRGGGGDGRHRLERAARA